MTTEFIPAEDRVRLSGEMEDGQVAIWLTRRLLGFLLPVLLQRLDDLFSSMIPAHRDALQEFAQQAASSSLEASAPVVTGDQGLAIVATEVDVGRTDEGVLLTIRNDAHGFHLPLSSQALRQWLHILYRADRQAEWNLPQWPAWLTGENKLALEPTVALH